MSEDPRNQPQEPLPESSTLVPAPAPAGAIPQDSWDRAVSAWITAHIRNSPVAQSAGAWSHLMTAIHELKPLLESELRSS